MPSQMAVIVNTAKTPHLPRAQTTKGPFLIFSISQAIFLGLIKRGVWPSSASFGILPGKSGTQCIASGWFSSGHCSRPDCKPRALARH